MCCCAPFTLQVGIRPRHPLLAYAIQLVVAEDFFEVLEARPLKFTSRRGLAGVYELLGRTHAGEYLHIAYRREQGRDVVFHMRAMSSAERKLFRNR
jgi:hypothetical protein